MVRRAAGSPGVLRALIVLSLAAVLPGGARRARAQAALESSGEPRRVDGRVLRGTPEGPAPAPGVTVVLHRVGSDRAGPLDSAVTDARGRYAFRYRTSGSADAIYFVSASYDGIAYFSSPLQQPRVSGDAAAITVFDTTRTPFEIHVAGRHLVFGSPDPRGRREVVEVYDLQNDSSVTLVSADDAHPVWSTHLPERAESATANPAGDIAPAAVRFAGDSVMLLAPLSPGIRQLSFSYLLPRDALPLAIPVTRPIGVLEVLAEEPRTRVSGARLVETAPVQNEGRTFRRFLAQDVPPGVVVGVDVPFTAEDARIRVLWAVAALFGAAMIGALVFAGLRRGRARVAPVAGAIAPVPPEGAETQAQALVRELAALDVRFEALAAPTPDERARYERERAELKARLAETLAAERQPA
ncbi:MAG TPA: hypothetical protein VJU87_02610 [Gemmatimonadaceae bacterium]|nr:hypothetical protein [Gemmatimonadaceae bacterium]